MLLFVYCISFCIFDIFGIFLSIEIQNILLLGFLSFNFPNLLSYKQTFQYFLLSAFFSGFMLMGITFLYYAGGTLHFIEICLLADILYENSFFIFGLFLILIGFIFKLGLFPFFFWVPEVFYFCPIIGLIPLVIIVKIVYLGLFLSFFN